MGKIVHVEYDVNIPLDNVTDDEIEEWLRFELRDNGIMNGNNPLSSYEPQPIFGTFYWDRIYSRRG